LIFIPTDPHSIQELSAQHEAQDLLRSFGPEADEAQTTDEIELVLIGADLERILYPVGETTLAMEW